MYTADTSSSIIKYTVYEKYTKNLNSTLQLTILSYNSYLFDHNYLNSKILYA